MNSLVISLRSNATRMNKENSQKVIFKVTGVNLWEQKIFLLTRGLNKLIFTELGINITVCF